MRAERTPREVVVGGRDDSLPDAPIAIVNARLVLRDRVEEGCRLDIAGGRIVGLGDDRPETGAPVVVLDAKGAYVLPGLIDVHNDGLEFEVNPRPGTNLPLPLALTNFERQALGAGVTTVFHALSFANRPDLGRSVGSAWERAAFIQQQQRRPVDHHVLHRFDVWSPDTLDPIFESMAKLPVRYLSLNDHTPGQGQYRDFAKHLERLAAYRERRLVGDIDPDELRRRMEERQRAVADGWLEGIYRAVAARRAALPCIVGTHDDDSPEKVDAQAAIGATIAEFPVTREAARQARRRGMAIVVGAPNIVRGGSHSGNLSAVELIAEGLADIICADYHAASLLPALLRLVDDGLCSLPEAVAMVTANPASALGLTDRGILAVGKRADVVIVRRETSVPIVEAVFSAGRLVYTYSGRAPEPLRREAAQEVSRGS
ncbi:MAG: alpha-D-ribose 1-methylphosphonate 5-triphosphate diphosphatase [Chloroflexota bacterium]|nr:alpha-D-ribose 1-methylphosphonate 5-triphosphate diphosphatase [Dehalococcoidia bacterium]MDW8255227.1 alpha-D-ribose 1-methylphosphonate 5-triphosphate diphosphatase [Chloroflexota bacterium]